MTDRERIAEAWKLLHDDTADAGTTLAVAEEMTKLKEFGVARRLFARAPKRRGFDAGDDATKRRIKQRQALCCYKDSDLHAATRFDRAMALLRQADDLDATTDPETLGIAGAILKYQWEATGKKQLLERSLAYYERGMSAGMAKDDGYTALNTAFVLDLLANIEEEDAAVARAKSEVAAARRARADAIRREILATIGPPVREPGREPERATDGSAAEETAPWWLLVTLAEAHFGLGEFAEAARWLGRANRLTAVADWEYETTARQLATLLRIRHPAAKRFEDLPEDATRTLLDFLRVRMGDEHRPRAALRNAFLGKMGLALSGGGFRASLFHIGVLARLAELDVLRHVEVLSCVSGGSIIGAHYYLELRRLLESKADGEIGRQDYVELVDRVSRQFLRGVQRNIRTRIAAEFSTNLRLAFRPSYSRTMRAGELYESELFARIEPSRAKRGPIPLSDLLVRPLGERPDFTPKRHNWQRSAKVPTLVLNATALNTGHNWQFTGTWMGEPPSHVEEQLEDIPRFRRFYHPKEAPPGYRDWRLGYAVAASACVPGLFEPIAMPGLYPGWIVRLVDGGVHDNQGIATLLEQGCTMVAVSDASGQMQGAPSPGAGPFAVPVRSNEILMARVRGAEFADVDARREVALLRGLMFIHLKQDIASPPLDWSLCPDPWEKTEEALAFHSRGTHTPYGVHRTIQRAIAGIRTDLDSFCDQEAFALMNSGYRMTELQFEQEFPGLGTPEAPRFDWNFRRIDRAMQGDPATHPAARDLLRILEVGRHRAFKIWRLETTARTVASVLLGAVALVGLYYAFQARAVALVTVGTLLMLLAAFALNWLGGRSLVRVLKPREYLAKAAGGVGMALFGCFAARLHLHVFDPWYLRRGRCSGAGSPRVPQSGGATPPHADPPGVRPKRRVEEPVA